MPQAKTEAPVEEPQEAVQETVEVHHITNEDKGLYIRNVGYSPVRVALKNSRDSEVNDKYRLAPRGQRGDVIPIEEEDEHLIRGRVQGNQAPDKGLYELLTAQEANAIMYQETTKQQNVHPAAAALRDEHGDPVRSIVVTRDTGGTVVQHITVPSEDGSSNLKAGEKV